MEALLLLTMIVAVLIGLGLAAVTWGVDSRDLVPDDHAR